MAGELVSFGIQKLWDLLSQECERFQGVEDQVTELKRALNLLSSFVKDADAKKHAVVKNCAEEIKDIVYDAEDIIEAYLLKEELRKKWHYQKTSDMRGISTRISKVIRDMKDFGVQNIITDGMESQPLQERQREMRQEFAKEYESELVGVEENIKNLVGYLVENDNVQVVSITGMGGLGKTTLAIDKPKEEEKKIMEMTEDTLHDELFRLLETSKALIVFDDIWKEEHWNLIKPIFPPEKGWKVLLTSRNEIVTTRRNTINFKPECLTTKDSWTLFQMIALPRKDGSGKHSRKIYSDHQNTIFLA